jgi:energy-coupling factor transport system permease protein
MRLIPYRPTGSPIHRLDPRVKLTWLLLFCAALLLFTAPGALLWPLIALIAAAALGRVLKPFIISLGIVMVVGGLSFILWPLVLTMRGQGGPTAWLFGLAMGLRLSSMLLCGLLVLFTSRMEEILAALSRLGFPFPVVFSVGLTFRLVPSLLADSFNVVEAQRLRGLRFNEGGLVRRARRYIPLLVPILGSALRSAHRMAWALEAKGFGSHRRVPFIELKMKPSDWIVLLLGMTAFGAAVAARLRGIGVLAGMGF